MTKITAEQIAQRALDLDLLAERQLDLVWSECGSRDVPPQKFRNLLVRHELLTNYQIEKLLRGERNGFHYGDYKVLYLVGTGSFARVYRACHKNDGRVVAVKVLRKRFSDDPVQTEQFLREGRLGSTLRHPNIVPIYEVHSIKRTYFLVMAFVEGQSLRDFVRIRKKVDPLEATELFAGTVSGLAHASEKGITHRDIKLSNVLISSEGRPQLVDFGLAANEKATDDGVNPRTIDYAALERATGVRKDDVRSDIYFAGCMYYHMLTGQAPLSDTRDRVQRLSVSRFKDVVRIRELLPEIPRSVESVVEKAMQLSPSERYSRPVEMLVDLQKAIKTQKSIHSSDSGILHSRESESRSQRIMLVEANASFQDALRTALKKFGYRVLVLGDPKRAFRRFMDDASCVDCVIVSTNGTDSAGLDLFNRLGKSSATREVPSVLLLGKNQAKLRQRAALSDKHVALAMPLRMKQLRTTLINLLEPAPAEKPA